MSSSPPAHSPQYLQISFTTLWTCRIQRLFTWNLPAGENPVQTHCVDKEDMNRLPWHWNLRSQASKTQFLKRWHAANLKPWKETSCVVLSWSAFQNRSQRIPKTGKGCPQSGCKTILRKWLSFGDARTSRCPESVRRTNGRKWKKSGTTDWIRSTRSSTWSKNSYVAWTPSSFPCGRERKEFVKSQMHPEIAQNLEHQEAQLRVQLQIEELMMTSMTEKFRESSGSEESCPQRTRVDDCSSTRNVTGIYSLYFLENRGNETYQGGGGAKHEEESRRELLASLICSSTTTRNGLFSTLYADRKSWFSIERCRDLQQVTHGSMFHWLPLH